MHIEIEKSELIKRLDILSRVATKHLTLPILQCVRIEAEGSHISLAGTNLEIGITATAPGVVKKAGVVAVPSGLLLQTIQLLPEATVALSLEGEALVVASRGSHSKINTFPVQDFPTIPELTGRTEKIEAAAFARGIRTVAFAASQSTIKPELGSIYIGQKKERTLTFVATDSFRLIEKTVPQQHITLENPLLIPQKNALEIARVLEVMGEDPDVIIGEGQVAFRFPDTTYLTTRLTEGSFPDYVQIIPKEFATHATLLTADLLHALKLTSVFANKFLQVGFKIHTSGEVVVSADNGEAGKTEERIAATVEGEDLTLSFNQKYVIDPLPGIQDESIVMHFAGVGRPLVLEGVTERSMRYLVMPMNK